MRSSSRIHWHCSVRWWIMVTMLDTSAFHAAVGDVFRKIDNLLSEADSEGLLDVENSGDILEISKAGVVYLISKRVVSRQIWVSSPLSGALKFGYDIKTISWIDTEKQELFATFKAEVGQLFGVELV